MSSHFRFRAFSLADTSACLALFDANCPEYFAPNERLQYESFLAEPPGKYELCDAEGQVVGVFGVSDEGAGRCRLNWIMLDPQRQGTGIGAAMMARVKTQAAAMDASVIDIAASHKSAGFFAKFGAREIRTTEHGWGPGMHRVDMELDP